MPKHRKHRSHKRKCCSSESSQERDPERKSRDRDFQVRSRERFSEARSSFSSSAGSLVPSSDLTSVLKDIFTFMKSQCTPTPPATAFVPTTETNEIFSPTLADDTIFACPEDSQADEQTVLENRGGEPDDQPPLPTVSFADLPQSSIEADDKENDPSLTNELFGLPPTTAESSWETLILNSTLSEVRAGLKEELRSTLLAKYELKGDLVPLGPPKVNKELVSALSKRQSILKRDEYQATSQIQVGACLNALGSGISDLLRLYRTQQPEAAVKDALTKLAEGVHLLADHQHRLSLARQAFIKPCLTFVGKSATDYSEVDEWLFGTTFAENLKSAQACEKAGRDLSRPYAASSSTPQRQPHQPTQQQAPTSTRKGNWRAPAPRMTASVRRPGATMKTNRYQTRRPRSRSHTRR